MPGATSTAWAPRPAPRAVALAALTLLSSLALARPGALYAQAAARDSARASGDSAGAVRCAPIDSARSRPAPGGDTLAVRAGATPAADARAAAQAPCPVAPPARRRGLRPGYVLPILGYAPETGVMFGVGGVRVSRRRGAPSSDRPSTLGAQLIGTQRSQATIDASGDWWTPGNRARYRAYATGSRFPFRFFGTGRVTASDTGEQYTPQTVAVGGSAQFLVARGLYVGGGYDLADVRMRRLVPGGLLDEGGFVGADGGRRASVLALGSRDTRDNVYFPRGGAFVTLSGRVAGGVFGSDFAFRRVRLDARRYLALGRSVLALQGVVDGTWGQVPFDVLPMLGGSSLLRGNLEGRYRDRALAAVQAEWRSGAVLFGRFGVVAFAGAGDVAPRLGALRGRSLIPSVGGGARFLLDPTERIYLRVDVAAGRNGASPYIGFSEAF